MPGSPASSLDDEETAAWFGFLTAHALLTREMDALLVAGHGMPLVEYEVLLKLSLAGGRLRMSDLAEVALLSRSGLTRIVDELESLGLVRREPDAGDRRVLLATLTPLGRRRLAAARRTHLDGVRRLFLERLTPAQRTAMAQGWSSILGPLRDAGPQRRGQRGRRPAPSGAARR